jgi:hypothetical protein
MNAMCSHLLEVLAVLHAPLQSSSSRVDAQLVGCTIFVLADNCVCICNYEATFSIGHV